MDYINQLPYAPDKNETIEIHKRSISYNQGRTWQDKITVEYTDSPFSGNRSENGPSMSGFWGDGSTRSGLIEKSCRRWDGKRWRKI